MVFRDAARRQRYAPNKPASIITTTWSRHPEVSLCFKKARSNSLFSRATSLFFRKISLFCCVGNFAGIL